MNIIYAVEFAPIVKSKSGRLKRSRHWQTVSLHVERSAAFAEKNERKRGYDKFQNWRVARFRRVRG